MGMLAGGVAAMTSCARTREGGDRTRRRPNIIYAFSDEHRWQSMSFSDMPELDTPNMARMASQGVEFTHCISNYPVCSPHRAILMTGRWPFQQGVIDNNIALRSDQATLGKTFREAGYSTGYIGKWHLGGTRAEAFGFDHSLIWTKTNAHWDTSAYHPAHGDPVTPEGYNATLMTDQALDFIEAHRREPFFLMVSWNPPHSDFLDAPDEKKALYPEGSLAQRQNANVPSASEHKSSRIWERNSWPHYQGYHAHVSAIDDELGRLMARLDELGLAEDTILVYSSDHGSMLGSHGVGSKRQPYEESIRVPFVIRWPGVIPTGVRSHDLFGSIDIMPTLCGIAGVPIPRTCQGLDFSTTLCGYEGPHPRSQFIMHISKDHASGGNTHPAPIFRGVRTSRYTFAVYPDRAWCLFDNREDPFQQRNLIDDPGHAEVRGWLESELGDWLHRAEDPFEVPE